MRLTRPEAFKEKKALAAMHARCIRPIQDISELEYHELRNRQGFARSFACTFGYQFAEGEKALDKDKMMNDYEFRQSIFVQAEPIAKKIERFTQINDNELRIACLCSWWNFIEYETEARARGHVREGAGPII